MPVGAAVAASNPCPRPVWTDTLQRVATTRGRCLDYQLDLLPARLGTRGMAFSRTFAYTVGVGIRLRT